MRDPSKRRRWPERDRLGQDRALANDPRVNHVSADPGLLRSGDLTGTRMLKRQLAGAPGAPSLSKREREAITLIARGARTPEIARQLHTSQDIVRTHVRNPMVKLGAHTRA